MPGAAKGVADEAHAAGYRRSRRIDRGREIDVPLDRSQWETLKALGAPDPRRWRVDDLAIQTLVTAKLAEIQEGRPVLTAEGRKAVVRGSPRLWDVSG